MTQYAIVVDDVVKKYRGRSGLPVTALDRVSFAVKEGEIFGLLGKNGAGKTTLLRIMTTLIRPSSGSVAICGYDTVRSPIDVRRSISIVLQEQAAELYLSVADNLSTYARFQSLPRSAARETMDAVMAQFGLTEHRDRKVIDLSGGLRRRVQVAKVFMVEKPVVFLDEATTGMDPINKRATLDAIRKRATKGQTIVLTTHVLQEAEELCDTIVLLDRGTCVARGDLQTIKRLVSQSYDVTVTFESLNQAILDQLRALPLVKLSWSSNTVEMSFRENDFSILESLGRLSASSRILHLEVAGASLEDVFLELLGRT